MTTKDDYPSELTNFLDINKTKIISFETNFPEDHDVFTVKLIAGKSYLLQVGNYYRTSDFGDQELDLHADIELRNNKKIVVATDDAQKSLHFFAKTSGTYYIDLSHGDANLSFINGISARNNNIFITQYQYKNDYSNDKTTVANLVLSKDKLHSIKSLWESIPSPYLDRADVPTFFFNETDWIKVSLVKGQSYQFLLINKDNDPKFDSTTIGFSLVDATGKYIISHTDSDLALSLVAPKTGVFYLSASDLVKSGNSDIPYTITGQQGVPIGDNKNNLLNGGAGVDHLYGLRGNDILNGNAGNDILNGGLGNDKINGGLGLDILMGNGGNDILNGGDGSDTLNGGTGEDIMAGGAGGDIYYVDNEDDIVKESVRPITEKDTIYTTVGYTLPANVEKLVLAAPYSGQFGGVDAILTINGNSADNILIARGDVEISGGKGNDYLIGYAAATIENKGSMIGGLGQDTYVIDKQDAMGSPPYCFIKIAKGDSLPSNFDVIKGFTAFYNQLQLPDEITTNVASLNGKDIGVIHSHFIKNGIISFDDIDQYANPLVLVDNQLSDTIKYIENNITQSGDTVAFVVGHDTYVFQDGGAVDTVVELVGFNATSIYMNDLSGTHTLGLERH